MDVLLPPSSSIGPTKHYNNNNNNDNNKVSHIETTAAVPASEVEATIPTNMASAKIAAADFNKMTTGGLLAAMFVGEDLLANHRLQMLLLF